MKDSCSNLSNASCSTLLSNSRRERLLKSKSRRSLVPANSQRSLGLGSSQRSLLDLSCHSLYFNPEEDDVKKCDETSTLHDEVKLEFEIPDTSDLMNLSFSSVHRRNLPREESFRSSCRSLGFTDRHVPKSFSGDSSLASGGCAAPRMPSRPSRRNLTDVPLMVVSSDENSDEEQSEEDFNWYALWSPTFCHVNLLIRIRLNFLPIPLS